MNLKLPHFPGVQGSTLGFAPARQNLEPTEVTARNQAAISGLTAKVSTSDASKNCLSSWKLNGNTYHGCSKDAVQGNCLCAVVIDPTTKELTHWKECWAKECTLDIEPQLEDLFATDYQL